MRLTWVIASPCFSHSSPLVIHISRRWWGGQTTAIRTMPELSMMRGFSILTNTSTSPNWNAGDEKGKKKKMSQSVVSFSVKSRCSDLQFFLKKKSYVLQIMVRVWVCVCLFSYARVPWLCRNAAFCCLWSRSLEIYFYRVMAFDRWEKDYPEQRVTAEWETCSWGGGHWGGGQDVAVMQCVHVLCRRVCVCGRKFLVWGAVVKRFSLPRLSYPGGCESQIKLSLSSFPLLSSVILPHLTITLLHADPLRSRFISWQHSFDSCIMCL